LTGVAAVRPTAGRLYVGTSGFAYPAWAPTFYPEGTRADGLLPAYAARLTACEINNTYYRQPTAERIAAWAAATPAGFRFAVKAQRGGSLRALLADPAGTLPWLVGPLAGFGERLGSVLFRVPDAIERDDARLRQLLSAWPVGLPLTFEFQHPSWLRDEVLARLADAGAAWCATDLDGRDPPSVRLTGPFLYLRLRREAYSPAELAAWAARIVPFVEAGHDVFAFFRHDELGVSALRAIELGRLVDVALRPSGAPAADDR
jgi:uncharacterized protein YecE (DUF72 family)